MEAPHPVVLALLGTGFTWLMTSLGASVVFTGLAVNRRVLDGMLGFAAGVMLAASFWSLLAPSLEHAEGGPLPIWGPAAIGFTLGGAAVWTTDKLLPHLHLGAPPDAAEGLKASWDRTTLLAGAIMLHNVPEGLSVGVAFGAVAADPMALGPAVALALGIGMQDFPEGIAVAMPLRGLGLSPARSFFFGQLSGALQVVAGVVGAIAVVTVSAILPYALAFAAGAMVFVVLEDVVPEAQHRGNIDLMTSSAIVGFVVMMILDVSLG